MCGHTFTGLHAFTWHEKGCVKGKKRLSGALSRAKEAYQSKKLCLQFGPVGPDQSGALEADQLEMSQQAPHDVPNLVITKHTGGEILESDKVCSKQNFDQGCY